MARFVVDCGVVLRLAAEEIGVSRGHELLAPTLLRSQTLSTLHEAVRAGKLDADAARERLRRVGAMPIRLLGDAVLRRRAWEVADELGWDSTYDAEYVALTLLQGDALVTLDRKLARSAAKLVRVAGFDELHGATADVHRVPELDDELRRRLGRRFGTTVEAWLDALPPVLVALAERWRIEYGSLIRRGTISVVIRCRTADGRPAVLKVSPDRRRIVGEAAALRLWTTPHVPGVLAYDETLAALLIEGIEPGTPLVESQTYPPLDELAALIAALHRDPDPAYEPVRERVSYLFDAGLKNYERRPDLLAAIPIELYERGRTLALRLADELPASALLHGDLTPSNVLDGGAVRGLVAVDPAPCVGDPAFDAVDLGFWRADDEDAVVQRASSLAPAIGAEPQRLLDWCSAFAAMVALELAESGETNGRVAMLIRLAEAL
jgi:streptomycin 6-kinase